MAFVTAADGAYALRLAYTGASLLQGRPNACSNHKVEGQSRARSTQSSFWSIGSIDSELTERRPQFAKFIREPLSRVPNTCPRTHQCSVGDQSRGLWRLREPKPASASAFMVCKCSELLPMMIETSCAVVRPESAGRQLRCWRHPAQYHSSSVSTEYCSRRSGPSSAVFITMTTAESPHNEQGTAAVQTDEAQRLDLCLFVVTYCGLRIGWAQQLTGQRGVRLAAPKGQRPVAADALRTSEQRMQQKAAHELFRLQPAEHLAQQVSCHVGVNRHGLSAVLRKPTTSQKKAFEFSILFTGRSLRDPKLPLAPGP